MAIKLMYITNRTDIALIAETAGVDRIFVDLEVIGKQERQGGMDTVQSKHSISDIVEIRKVLTKAELLVRSNPIHENSKQEIDDIVSAGADLIMLPYFKTVREVETFVSYVAGRAKTMLLIETPEAVEAVDEILGVKGIDEVFVGLNDLSLGYGKKFMFELLADGTVENLCNKFKSKGYEYGFGGIASLNGGLVPGSMILKEHYRLHSSSVILSRSFCNAEMIENNNEIVSVFTNGIAELRRLEKECCYCLGDKTYFEKNRQSVKEKVEIVVRN